jgi:hypothetical protein
LRIAEQTPTAAPQEERKDRKSHASFPLSDYLSVWSRNEGEVLRMAEQTATAAPQEERMNRKSLATLPLSEYLGVWSRNDSCYSPFIGLPEHLEQK